MTEHRNQFVSDLMEAAKEMVAIERGERESGKTYRYTGSILTEIAEDGRVVWRLSDVSAPESALDPLSPAEIRTSLRQTQEGFSELLGIPIGTLRGWEQGRRTPRGPSETLLRVTAVEPGALLKLRTAPATAET